MSSNVHLINISMPEYTANQMRFLRCSTS